MADKTPAEWLPILAKRMDDNMPRVKLLKRYVCGDAPLPEADKNTQEAWRRFQKQARTNWGRMIREAVADRIVPMYITVGGSHTSPEAKRAQEIWRNNRMDSVFKEWVRGGLTFSESYMTTWSANKAGDTPVITADTPETMCVSTDPLQPWRVRAALRTWRDLDANKDFALVWIDGQRQQFEREAMFGAKKRLHKSISSDDWKATDGKDPVATSGPPPVVVWNNPDGEGEFEAHLDVIDRINGGVLRRLTVESMLAFRSRALKMADAKHPGLPKHDADGNEIDWTQVLPFAPGALWNLPPGIDIWESTPTDIGPLLMGSKDDIRHLSASTATPLPMLMPDNANQTAKGASATESAYLSKCGERAAQAKIGGIAVLVEALKADDGTDLQETLDLALRPVEQVSLSEQYAAAQAAGSVMPRKTVWRNVLMWSPDQIAQAELDAADEALQAALNAPKPTNDTPPPNKPAQQQKPKPDAASTAVA